MSVQNLVREWRTVNTGRGSIDVYVAADRAGVRPAVIMFPEIFGVNDAMKDEAARIAEQGFSVAVPDIFWRQETRVDLGYSPDDRKRGFGFMQNYDFAEGIADMAAVTKAVEAFDDFAGPASMVGFCLGGKLALLVGAKTGAPAIISFYGVRLDQNVDLIRAYKGAFQFHVGSRDDHIPAETISAVSHAVKAMPNAEVFVYEGAAHGFFNRVRSEVYDAGATRTAFDRAMAALRVAR